MYQLSQNSGYLSTLNQTASYEIHLNENMYCGCLSRSTLRLARNISYVLKINLGIFYY